MWDLGFSALGPWWAQQLCVRMVSCWCLGLSPVTTVVWLDITGQDLDMNWTWRALLRAIGCRGSGLCWPHSLQRMSRDTTLSLGCVSKARVWLVALFLGGLSPYFFFPGAQKCGQSPLWLFLLSFPCCLWGFGGTSREQRDRDSVWRAAQLLPVPLWETTGPDLHLFS